MESLRLIIKKRKKRKEKNLLQDGYYAKHFADIHSQIFTEYLLHARSYCARKSEVEKQSQ